MCGNFTPTESLQTNFTKIYMYILLLLKMDDDDNDNIIAATCTNRCLLQKYQQFWPMPFLFPLLLPPDSYSKVEFGDSREISDVRCSDI